MNVHVIFQLSIWLDLKMNLFQKYEHKKINFFSNNKLKFNLEPRNYKSVYM